MKKTLLKRITAVLLATVTACLTGAYAFADGGVTAEPALTADAALASCESEYAYVSEASTGSEIASKNSDKSFHMGHFAKLMTIYLAAKKIDSGEMTPETEITVSPEANKQDGTQIWLDAGEKISVAELLKSICIGNANDACFALAEGLCKNSAGYLSLANETAVSLGMDNTHFADVTGIDEKSVTTARDIAVISGEIIKYEFLREYFCTWIDEVRGGKTQLVNTNRLVRSYNGISGLKACYDELSGNCLVATAEQNGMTLVCVTAGCDDADARFQDGKNLLDFGFSAYELYTPEIPEEVLENVRVKNGAKAEVKVNVSDRSPVLIKKGSSSGITPAFEKMQKLDAPVKKGQKVGNLRLVGPQEVVFECEIKTSESVSKMSVGLAFERLWLKLLKLG